jgi:hypothetical protein
MNWTKGLLRLWIIVSALWISFLVLVIGPEGGVLTSGKSRSSLLLSSWQLARLSYGL